MPLDLAPKAVTTEMLGVPKPSHSRLRYSPVETVLPFKSPLPSWLASQSLAGAGFPRQLREGPVASTYCPMELKSWMSVWTVLQLQDAKGHWHCGLVVFCPPGAGWCARRLNSIVVLLRSSEGGFMAGLPTMGKDQSYQGSVLGLEGLGYFINSHFPEWFFKHLLAGRYNPSMYNMFISGQGEGHGKSQVWLSWISCFLICMSSAYMCLTTVLWHIQGTLTSCF